CYCFFFQAEDGIRDFHVTGVQTCALPIFPMLVLLMAIAFVVVPQSVAGLNRLGVAITDLGWERVGEFFNGITTRNISNTARVIKIGRASCRERQWSSV